MKTRWFMYYLFSKNGIFRDMNLLFFLFSRNLSIEVLRYIFHVNWLLILILCTCVKKKLSESEKTITV